MVSVGVGEKPTSRSPSLSAGLNASWARAAGIDKPLSPHWLRHTFGTLTALGGANVFQIQRDMGHAQITTSHLLALVTDQQFDLGVPHFGLNDASAVADLLERRFGLTPTGKAAAVRG